MRRVASRRDLALVASGGAGFALASPPTDFFPAIFLGLAALAASVERAKTAKSALGRGVLWGTAAGIVGLRFVPPVIQRFTPLGLGPALLAHLLLAAAQSLVWGLGAAAAHLLARRVKMPFPLAYAAGVFMAVSLPTVFVWTPAGLLSSIPELVQLAELIGERGVSLLFALASAWLAGGAAALLAKEAWRPRLRASLAWMATSLALLLAMVLFGRWRMGVVARELEGRETMKVALVDQSVEATMRWDPKNHRRILERLRSLSRQAEAAGADLVVWPEAAYPYPLERPLGRIPRGVPSPVGGGVRGPILVGLITRDRPVEVEPGVVERRSYNSATLVSPDGSMQRAYDKLELLWFGETVPLGGYFPWLRRLFQRSGGIFPGTQAFPLVAETPEGPVRLGVLNCYEDTLPRIGLRVAREALPQLLVNVTNDAWFFETAEPELHARLATMRAVELRIDLVRAVNRGVVSWVDAAGRVRLRREGTSPGFVMAEPALLPEGAAPSTLYARFGDAPTWAALGALALAFRLRSHRRAGPSAPEPKGEGSEGS